MLSPDLPQALDDLGIEMQRFGTLRHQYYEAVHSLVGQGRKAEAIELIKLAVGIYSFDEALTTPVAERKYRPPSVLNQPRNVHTRTALSQLTQFEYSGQLPFCYELLSQDSFLELREAADVIFDGITSNKNKLLVRLGKRVCESCIFRNQCAASLSFSAEA